MDPVVIQERERLIREGRRHADVERRSWSFIIQLTVALGLFALAPLLPRARHLFGALSIAHMVVILLPGVVAACVGLFVYRRYGPESRAYAIAEAIESCLLYFANVNTAFGTKMTWTVLWILCPFTALFWASTKPFDRRLHVGIMALCHAVSAALFYGRGDPDGAWVTLAIGLGSSAFYEVLAHQARRSVALEAERNVVRARLNEALFDHARREVATTLQQGIGREIASLANELDELDAKHVADALTDLQSIARSASASGLSRSCSLPDLLARIDSKCRPLCEDRDYASLLESGDHAASALDDEQARGLVLLAQELVRNAVVHGTARRVRVDLSADGTRITLRIEDDGSGLGRDRFDQATGGLSNSMQWLGENGGRLELLPTSDRGTALAASLPTA